MDEDLRDRVNVLTHPRLKAGDGPRLYDYKQEKWKNNEEKV